MAPADCCSPGTSRPLLSSSSNFLLAARLCGKQEISSTPSVAPFQNGATDGVDDISCLPHNRAASRKLLELLNSGRDVPGEQQSAGAMYGDGLGIDARRNRQRYDAAAQVDLLELRYKLGRQARKRERDIAQFLKRCATGGAYQGAGNFHDHELGIGPVSV